MRKIVGFVLLGLGAALLAVGVITTTWAPGKVERTPIDINTTTMLDGEGARYDAEAGELGEQRPIRITSVTKTDSEASDDDVAVFVSYQCIVYTDEGDVPDCPEGEDDRIFNIPEPDRFATDRETGLAVDPEGYVPDDFITVQHDGIVNKFPFDTQQEEYPYWDGLTEQSWPAEFVGTEDMDGLEVYHFEVSIEDAEAEVSEGIDGTYSNTIGIYVEPKTGGIVRQTQDQQRYFDDGTQVLDLQADFTDEQIETSIADAKDNVSSLELVTRTLPIVGFVGGAVMLVVGALLLLMDRRRRDDTDDDVFGDNAPRDKATV